MTTKMLVVLAFYVVAAVLFLLDGINVNIEDYFLTALGLLSLTIGFILDKFWSAA